MLNAQFAVQEILFIEMDKRGGGIFLNGGIWLIVKHIKSRKMLGSNRAFIIALVAKVYALLSMSLN